MIISNYIFYELLNILNNYYIRNIVIFNKLIISLYHTFCKNWLFFSYIKSDKAGFIKPLQRIRGTYYRKILKTNKEIK